MKSEIAKLDVKDLLNKLKEIKGEELKYSQLCKKINLKIKSSDSKTAQLNDLQMYCQLNKLDGPTRYVVEEVYDDVVLGLGILNKNNKYQLLFEAAIYQAFLNNNGEPLWLSNMEMLKLFQEVNENFSYACNSEAMRKLGEEFAYMAEMSQVVYKILRQWTKRRIEFMEKRDIVILRKGYRLYIQCYGQYGPYKVSHNVSIGSQEEKICQEIYEQAVKEKMPEQWEGEWVPDWKWVDFERHIGKLTKERFDNEYCDLRHITIISPPTKEWLESRLMETYSKIEDLTGINQEACQKIMTTTQLDKNTGEERRKFVEVNMAIRPTISLKEKLKEKKQ